jgi:hypothetical protein
VLPAPLAPLGLRLVVWSRVAPAPDVPLAPELLLERWAPVLPAPLPLLSPQPTLASAKAAAANAAPMVLSAMFPSWSFVEEVPRPWPRNCRARRLNRRPPK